MIPFAIAAAAAAGAAGGATTVGLGAYFLWPESNKPLTPDEMEATRLEKQINSNLQQPPHDANALVRKIASHHEAHSTLSSNLFANAEETLSTLGDAIINGTETTARANTGVQTLQSNVEDTLLEMASITKELYSTNMGFTTVINGVQLHQTTLLNELNQLKVTNTKLSIIEHLFSSTLSSLTLRLKRLAHQPSASEDESILRNKISERDRALLNAYAEIEKLRARNVGLQQRFDDLLSAVENQNNFNESNPTSNPHTPRLWK